MPGPETTVYSELFSRAYETSPWKAVVLTPVFLGSASLVFSKFPPEARLREIHGLLEGDPFAENPDPYGLGAWYRRIDPLEKSEIKKILNGAMREGVQTVGEVRMTTAARLSKIREMGPLRALFLKAMVAETPPSTEA